jgi:hypothetical protein
MHVHAHPQNISYTAEKVLLNNRRINQSTIQSISQSSHVSQPASISEVRLQQFLHGLNFHEVMYNLKSPCHDPTYPDSTLQCSVIQPLVLLLDVSQINLTTAHNNTNQSTVISSCPQHGFVELLGKESWWTPNIFNWKYSKLKHRHHQRSFICAQEVPVLST